MINIYRKGTFYPVDSKYIAVALNSKHTYIFNVLIQNKNWKAQNSTSRIVL